MTETHSSMKVYELAKELGMDSFGLLDTLKQIDIEVKSHMSSLAAEQTKAVREFLEQKNSDTAKGSKKKVTRKKVAKKNATAKKAKTSKVTASATEADETKTVASKTAKTVRKKVIKRRATKSDEGETQQESVVVSAPEPEAPKKAPSPEDLFKKPEEIAAEALKADVSRGPTQEEVEAAKIAKATKERQSSISPQKAFKKVEPEVKKAADPKPKKAVLEDEMLDHSFMRRKLKIVKDAPETTPEEEAAKANEGDSEYNRFKTPGAPEQGTGVKGNRGASGGREMFRPVTSVLGGRDEDSKRGRSGVPKPQPGETLRATDFRKREVIFQPKRKKLPPGKMVQKTQITVPSAKKRKIKVTGAISVAELAQRMGEKPKALLRKLIDLGEEISSINEQLDIDTAALVAAEFTYEIENVTFNEAQYFGPEEDAEESLVSRPPVVAVMGHVDHGKTTLLDTIRSTSVVKGEAGGITQHIGAYSVTVDKHDITFLDTPGHEAFSTMRQRGANATDIVILVVAADDGIMPQTKEAIRHAQNAEVPIIVAANKIDKPEANLDRLKQALSEHNILVEEWGGEVPLVPVSALKGDGIKDLLETIYLQAEILELKSNPGRLAQGIVLESRMQKGRGIVTDVVVQNGTLNSGDYIVCGPTYGRVRAMMNDQGKVVKSVKPGYPVEFTGLNDVPSAGDLVYAVESEAIAKEIVSHRKAILDEEVKLASEFKPKTIEELFAEQEEKDGKKTLNLMLKADVFGSIEAIEQSVKDLPNDKVTVNIVSKAVGTITENDSIMASTSGAQIFGFNVKPDAKAKQIAKRDDVVIHSFSIIYELLDQVKSSMEDLLEPIRVETQIGSAEVKQPFNVSKVGRIAGCSVLDGKVIRHSWAKVIRGKDIICEGDISSLKRFKDDVKETTKGQECGIGVDGYADIEPGDLIQVFRVEFKKATL